MPGDWRRARRFGRLQRHEADKPPRVGFVPVSRSTNCCRKREWRRPLCRTEGAGKLREAITARRAELASQRPAASVRAVRCPGAHQVISTHTGPHACHRAAADTARARMGACFGQQAPSPNCPARRRNNNKPARCERAAFSQCADERAGRPPSRAPATASARRRRPPRTRVERPFRETGAKAGRGCASAPERVPARTPARAARCVRCPPRQGSLHARRGGE